MMCIAFLLRARADVEIISERLAELGVDAAGVLFAQCGIEQQEVAADDLDAVGMRPCVKPAEGAGKRAEKSQRKNAREEGAELK